MQAEPTPHSHHQANSQTSPFFHWYPWRHLPDKNFRYSGLGLVMQPHDTSKFFNSDTLVGMQKLVCESSIQVTQRQQNQKH